MEKFKLTSNSIKVNNVTLYQIEAVKFIRNRWIMISVGDLGGYVESEKNLDQSDNSWIFSDVKVMGDALVTKDSIVRGDITLSDNVVVSDYVLYANVVLSGSESVTPSNQSPKVIFGEVNYNLQCILHDLISEDSFEEAHLPSYGNVHEGISKVLPTYVTNEMISNLKRDLISEINHSLDLSKLDSPDVSNDDINQVLNSFTRIFGIMELGRALETI